MLQFILQQNPLTDNFISIPEKGKVFKGGFVAIVKEYTYQNAWSDKESVRKFRSKARLCTFLDKKYPDHNVDFSGTCLDA